MSETNGENKYTISEVSPNELLATAMAPIPEPAYKPTRLEHFAVQILQGLIVGRSDQILPKVVSRSIALAKKLELALDGELVND